MTTVLPRYVKASTLGGLRHKVFVATMCVVWLLSGCNPPYRTESTKARITRSEQKLLRKLSISTGQSKKRDSSPRPLRSPHKTRARTIGIYDNVEILARLMVAIFCIVPPVLIIVAVSVGQVIHAFGAGISYMALIIGKLSWRKLINRNKRNKRNKLGKPSKPDKPDKPDKPSKPSKPSKPDKPGKKRILSHT